MACKVEGCERSGSRFRGYCSMHYQRVMKNGHPGPPESHFVPNAGRSCSVGECASPARNRGMCWMHYQRMQKHGTTDPNPIRVDGRWLMVRCLHFDVCGATVAAMSTTGLCTLHRERQKRGRDPKKRIRGRDTNYDWYVNVHGYVTRYTGCVDGSATYELQHRVLMAEHIGRPLVKGENVHHINGDRADNRIENLELWNTSQPSGQRVPDKVAWAIELLSLYAPEALTNAPLQLRLVAA